MVREFRDTHYHGTNMYLIVCGDVSHDLITQQAAGAFASIPAESPNSNLIVQENLAKPIFTGSAINIRDDDLD